MLNLMNYAIINYLGIILIINENKVVKVAAFAEDAGTRGVSVLQYTFPEDGSIVFCSY